MVRLTPFMATDPFRAKNFRIVGGTFIISWLFWVDVTSEQKSMWPLTKWPSSPSPILSGFSRFTREPGL